MRMRRTCYSILISFLGIASGETRFRPLRSTPPSIRSEALAYFLYVLLQIRRRSKERERIFTVIDEPGSIRVATFPFHSFSPARDVFQAFIELTKRKGTREPRGAPFLPAR